MSTSEDRRLRRASQRRRRAARDDVQPFLTTWFEIPARMVPERLREAHPDAWEWITGTTVLLGREEPLATGLFPVEGCVQDAVRASAPVMAERAEMALEADRLF